MQRAFIGKLRGALPNISQCHCMSRQCHCISRQCHCMLSYNITACHGNIISCCPTTSLYVVLQHHCMLSIVQQYHCIFFLKEKIDCKRNLVIYVITKRKSNLFFQKQKFVPSPTIFFIQTVKKTLIRNYRIFVHFKFNPIQCDISQAFKLRRGIKK